MMALLLQESPAGALGALLAALLIFGGITAVQIWLRLRRKPPNNDEDNPAP